jgi:predicted nucleotide-binding protein
VRSQHHVFLGYSSQAAPVAEKIKKYLTDELGLRVYDWHSFQRMAMIWESIARAERQTQCGVFLFMADDTLTDGRTKRAAPRDNVVYEAGYFAGAKGRAHAIIIREGESKLPSNLEGMLYLSLESRSSIESIQAPLRKHLSKMLEAGVAVGRAST